MQGFPALVQQILPIQETENSGLKLCKEKQRSSQRRHGSPVEVTGVAASSQGCWLQADVSHLPSTTESPMRGLGKKHISFQESLAHGGQSDLGRPTGYLRASQMLSVAQRSLPRGWRPHTVWKGLVNCSVLRIHSGLVSTPAAVSPWTQLLSTWVGASR